MSSWLHVALAILLGPVLWLAGAIAFDGVHWLLHGLLRSRSRWLRGLAWPHAVHHRWIDRRLRVHWGLRTANVWCHVVPEYLTQLAFTAALSWLLPAPYVVVLAVLQTAAFAFVLRDRGLDANHRPAPLLDAYAPGPLTPPAYHALHHVHPDAHFSAYTKVVDWVVGAGTSLRERRFAILGADGRFGRALDVALRRAGVEHVEAWRGLDPERLRRLDVLVVGEGEVVEATEAFVRATRTRQLPPEVWAVYATPDDPTARHYHHDVRVNHRTIVRSAADGDASRAAAVAVRRIRRGFNFVSTARWWHALAELRRFRRTVPAPPPGIPTVQHRTDLLPPPSAEPDAVAAR